MSGLEETFEGQVDFIMLNWDDSSFSDTRQKLGITDRAQYLLVDPDGNVVKRWYGLLNEGAVKSEIMELIKA